MYNYYYYYIMKSYTRLHGLNSSKFKQIIDQQQATSCQTIFSHLRRLFLVRVYRVGQKLTRLILMTPVILLEILLQRVSIACYAERCISYDRSVRLTVCLSQAGIMPKRLNLHSRNSV